MQPKKQAQIGIGIGLYLFRTPLGITITVARSKNCRHRTSVDALNVGWAQALLALVFHHFFQQMFLTM